MTNTPIPVKGLVPQVDGTATQLPLPTVIANADSKIARRYIEFFFVEHRNKNTRTAYRNAITRFLDWCDQRGLTFEAITPLAIAAYIETEPPGAKPTINQHLTAIRQLFEWMVKGNLIAENPAAEVKGVKHKVATGATPVLSDDEMLELLDSIDVSHVVGLRDRALIATMFYSFARVGAVLSMKVKDYFPKGKRYWLRLQEKGGKRHEVPAHHTLERYLDDYIEAGGLASQLNTPLFRTTRGRSRKLTPRGLQPREALAMVKRKAIAAGINTSACNHTFRASGITNFLRNGGSLDNAQKIAAHSDSRTTKLYDRRRDEISLDEIERIRL